jgi:hypothetical protein
MFANEARGEMNSFNEFLNTYYPIVKLHTPPEYIATPEYISTPTPEYISTPAGYCP